MGLRDMLRRSAKAIFDEVVDRVLERREERAPPVVASRAAAPAAARGAEPAVAPASREPAVALEAAPSAPAARAEREPTPRAQAASAEAPAGDQMTPRPQVDREMVREPILTRTMAGVLAAQGYHERALRIYDHLLKQAPENDDLEAEAESVRARMAEGDGPPEDEVAAVPVKKDSLLVSWKVTPRSIERARSVLGGEGKLTARVVVVARGKGADVSRETREHAVGAEMGEHLFTEIPRRARCTASVGLLAKDRFVSVAHSRVVPT